MLILKAAAAVTHQTNTHVSARRGRVTIYLVLQRPGFGNFNACECSRFSGGKPPHFHERWYDEHDSTSTMIFE